MSDVGFRPGRNNKTMQILNRLASKVREEGPLELGVLAVKCGMAPSTLYSYRGALLGLFQDIKYDRGTFSSLAPEKKEEPVPQGATNQAGGS